MNGRSLILGLGCLLTLSSAACRAARPPADTGPGRDLQPAWAAQPCSWFRGNTHTHTSNSDGRDTPGAVAARYRELGYDFLVITDHGAVTPVAGVNSQHGEDGRFLVIPGQELATSLGAPVHVIGMNMNGNARMPRRRDRRAAIEDGVDEVGRRGGLAILAHPTYKSAIDGGTIASASRLSFVEIYNGLTSSTRNGVSADEEIWDAALAGGRIIYGVASDDAHNLNARGAGSPGRAWVMVHAPSLDAASIVQSMRAGAFYATTGVKLRDLSAEGPRLSVRVDTGEPVAIEFVGQGGRVLGQVSGTEASYELKDEDTYVRARVTDRAGRRAWTQPLSARWPNSRGGPGSMPSTVCGAVSVDR